MASSRTICVLEDHHCGGSLLAVSHCMTASSKGRRWHATSHGAVGFGWISNLDSFNIKLTVLSALPRMGHQHSTFPPAVCCRGHLSVKTSSPALSSYFVPLRFFP